jgi:LysW-gamma-L-lysine carboxypeptidase
MLVDRMNQLGLHGYVDEAGNAVGLREKPDPTGKFNLEIVLLGHIDTVPGEIPVRIEDGKLFGRGAVDAKGPLTAFLFAAARTALQPGTRLVVIGAVEEESATSKGARFAAQCFSPDYCIIGEPSSWNSLTLGYKGRLLVDYNLQQPMSHTAGPHTSVAEEAVRWWTRLQEYVASYNQRRNHLFDQLLPSLRGIHTDSDGLNDKVQMKIGLRLPLDFDFDTFCQEAESWAGESNLSFYGFEPAFKTDRRSSLAAIFNQIFRENDIQPRVKLKTGTSDMNVVGPIWNCPIVAYGPGDSLLDHTPNEHLRLLDYVRSIELLQSVLERLQTY